MYNFDLVLWKRLEVTGLCVGVRLLQNRMDTTMPEYQRKRKILRNSYWLRMRYQTVGSTNKAVPGPVIAQKRVIEVSI